MEQDRLKWNNRYGGEGFFIRPDPSRFLVEQIDLIEFLVPGKKALDIACGEGRNSIFMAQRGFRVTGVDISETGLAKAADRAAQEGVSVNFIRQDLDTWQFHGAWDLVLNFNFLMRDLIPQAVAALTPGGIMLLDTILATPALIGNHNPIFLLQPGELAQLFTGLPGSILHCEELPRSDTPTARLMFRKTP